ncbi:MAG TPA: elongation factor P maturation arginine rhamnosyltransferase EarP [Halothiobacillus sp.]|nr:elongation factor P maturation arginine rhamnosyltransferase EarP [Halothiobacillus sp.]
MARQFVAVHSPVEPGGLLTAGSETALTAPINTPQTWDIFCRVIDNFGDIGVSWRLARLLTDEHDKAVRLWVDDLSALSRLVPATDVTAEIQKRHDIEVCRWSTDFPDATPASVVIEAFGCALPDRYVSAMPEHSRVWFNLEYFTAEPWAAGCHGLSSPQPNGIAKIFAFPGIQPGTGGLLRETTLLTDRQEFLQQPAVRLTWADRWHIPLPTEDSLAILLFGYENAALSGLLNALAASPTPITAYLPEGRPLNAAHTALNAPDLAPGAVHHQGALTLHVLPFLPQIEFDRLLWLCDINFVRGEDSLARAIWAGKPLIWQIYPTEDKAHWTKLDALLVEFGRTLGQSALQAWQQLNRDWNAQIFIPAHWNAVIAALPELRAQAELQMRHLSEGEELAQWLVKTAEQRLQCATI